MRIIILFLIGIILLSSLALAAPQKIEDCSYGGCMLTIPRYKIFQSMNDPDSIWVIFQNSRNENLVKTINGGQTWDAALPQGQFDLSIQPYLDYHASLGGDEQDNLYVADRCYSCNSQSQVFFRKLNAPVEASSDFENYIAINGVAPGSLQTPNILVQDSNNIFVIMRTSGNSAGNIYYARSTNGGASFSSPQLIHNAGVGNVRIGSFLLDQTPAVILHYVDSTGTPQLDYQYFVWNGNQFVANDDSIVVQGMATHNDREYSMAWADGEVHLVYNDREQLRHAWKAYNNGQGTWNDEVVESFAYDPRDWHPSLSRHGTDLYMFYLRQETTTEGSNNVYWRKWNKTTQSWSAPTQVTTNALENRYPHGPAIVNPSSTFIPFVWGEAGNLDVMFDRIEVSASPECTNGAIRSCGTTDVGVCTLGTETCSGGSWGSCVGAVYPGTENDAQNNCNDGLDNDCDGLTDYNETSDCTPPECTGNETRQCGTTDVGVCSYGIETCSDGSWGSCVGNIDPGLENDAQNNCDDGLDNDCDGLTDYYNETIDCTAPECTGNETRQCGTTDVGVCSYGIETCSDGSWGSCIGAIDPAAENCTDSIDNDCDGFTDSADTVDCPTTCTLPYDTEPCDDCIESPELVNSVLGWYTNTITELELIANIQNWKVGGC